MEEAGTHQSQWIRNEENVNMRNVIGAIQQRNRVPAVIDVQPINEWAKMKAYSPAKMAENQYSIRYSTTASRGICGLFVRRLPAR